MTIEEFGRRLRARQITALEVTEACLRRIDEENPRLNAFIRVLPDQARSRAAEADRELAAGHDRGPLHGVPISIKDLFDIQGTPTTAASRVREGHVADRDAVAIARLRDAGAVIIGKTNLHEFAFGTTNEESAFGPAHHPLDPGRSPGGSSGGSAISVATGMALASLGTDTGGSIRIPAAACGTVGLKPSYGEVSLDGAVPLSTTFDHAGPLTQSVIDAWHMYRALIGDRAAQTLDSTDVGSLRLAVPRQYFCDVLDDGVRSCFETAVSALCARGAQTTDVAIAHAHLTVPVYMHISFGEAAAYHAATLDAMPDRYTPPVRLRLEAARYVMAEDYVRALRGRETLRQEVDAALDGYDALMLPTLPIPAPAFGAVSATIGASTHAVRSLMLRLTQLFNVTGHPAISLPCGRTDAGLPCGLQLVGRRMETVQLLRVAAAVEQATRA